MRQSNLHLVWLTHSLSLPALPADSALEVGEVCMSACTQQHGVSVLSASMRTLVSTSSFANCTVRLCDFKFCFQRSPPTGHQGACTPCAL
ncbi:hypothetical protein DUNSADRAFT_1224 [Dunaliella salina]|uniref:Secreted protein n=1 Tax=Dunaliella salina TaxID=3046 RepID=A0ABQ7FXS2_DUNSA|nr:hypothetical protein DUNSADRAFT_1224 [Dunaliella salina]|eukprot:KAF5827162.1 hypothetical protein DUNSADRAFT_1224 [Dunaliella salina]